MRGPYQFSDKEAAMLSGFIVFYTSSAILPLKRLKRQRTTCDWQIYTPRRDIKLTTTTLPDTYILGNSFLAKSPKRGRKEAEFIDIHGAEPNDLGFPTKYRIMLIERKADCFEKGSQGRWIPEARLNYGIECFNTRMKTE